MCGVDVALKSVDPVEWPAASELPGAIEKCSVGWSRAVLE